MKWVLSVAIVVNCTISIAQDNEKYILPEMCLNDTILISITNERGIYSYIKQIELIKFDEVYQVCYYSQDTSQIRYKVDERKVPENKLWIANEICECLNNLDEDCFEKIEYKYLEYFEEPWYKAYYEFELDSCELLHSEIKRIHISKEHEGMRFKVDNAILSILYKEKEQTYRIKQWLDFNHIIFE